MDTFMPASAILPLPTTRSSYWSPLASLCTLPVPGRPGRAGAAGVAEVVEAAGAGVVTLADVLCSVDELDFSALSRQPAVPSASSMPRARNSFDIRDSFRVG